MSTQLSLEIETKHEELGRVSSAVEEFGHQENWPPDLVFKVNLALEEVVVNVINYGHEDGLHNVEITFTASAETLTIEVVDDGRPFDPLTEAPRPDLSGELEDRRIGGLGVHLVREMMDDVGYRREEGKNILTMVTSMKK